MPLHPENEKKKIPGDGDAQAATLIAAAGADQQFPFDEFVRKYLQTYSGIFKAHLQYLMCAQPSNETIGSGMLVYPVPSKFDQKDILKCICNQKILRMDFITCMEVLVLLQRNKLKSPDYHKLTNIKDIIGKNSLLQSNIQLQLHSLQ